MPFKKRIFGLGKVNHLTEQIQTCIVKFNDVPENKIKPIMLLNSIVTDFFTRSESSGRMSWHWPLYNVCFIYNADRRIFPPQNISTPNSELFPAGLLRIISPGKHVNKLQQTSIIHVEISFEMCTCGSSRCRLLQIPQQPVMVESYFSF